MKRLIFIILFSVTFVLSATEISTEFVSGTWTSGGSPYNVNCDIQIPDGETLSIEPGTEIVFQGHYWINVQGQILAEGTEGDNIIFRAENQEEGWMGVRFDQTPISNGPSNINYCHFSYGNAN
ncbi:MAG: hypothetical protein KAS62_10800, partial [Candidatus Delongbacteria bacterium]|nr:hypothetical protein [Candidatus Delongbacteria bacterium]